MGQTLTVKQTISLPHMAKREMSRSVFANLVIGWPLVMPFALLEGAQGCRMRPVGDFFHHGRSKFKLKTHW